LIEIRHADQVTVKFVQIGGEFGEKLLCVIELHDRHGLVSFRSPSLVVIITQFL
jgi:hypothetical protein